MKNKNENKLLTDIVMVGYYGCNNAGDDAMLASILNGIRSRIPDIKITVISVNPRELSKRHNVDTINRSNYFKIHKTIKNSKLLLFGGGSIFQNITSSRSLLYYIHLISIAKRANKKIMLLGNGIGPIKGGKYLKKTCIALNKTNLITLRDKDSKTFLIDNNINKPVIKITTDPVFGLNVEIKKENKLNNPKNIGVSLRNWPKINISVLANFFDILISKYNYNITFIPMQPAKDLIIINKVLNKMKSKGNILYETQSHTKLLDEFNKFDLIFGMRLHSLIFSALNNKPFIGIEYDPKVNAIINDFNQGSFGSPSDFTIDGLLKNFNDFIQNFSDYKNSLIINLQRNIALSKTNIDILIKLLEDS